MNSRTRDRGGKVTATASSTSRGVDDILSKEEEYKRLNEELEARKAALDQETEAVFREHEALFARKPSMLDNVELNYDGQEWDQYVEDYVASAAVSDETKLGSRKTPATTNVASKKQPVSARRSTRLTTMQQPKGKTQSVESKKPKDRVAGVVAASSYEAGGQRRSEVLDNDDDNESGDYIQRAISGIGSSLEAVGDRSRAVAAPALDDIIPPAANEMASEAQIRFLKAKLQVTHEEVERLLRELNSKDDALRETQAKLKEVEEEKGRLQRSQTTQQAQMQKYKKLTEDAKEKADTLEVQLTNAKKELDSMKKNQKQQATSQGTVEVRLNRALEDCEKYKMQLDKVKAGTKENMDAEKRRLEELVTENKRLEKQKTELMNGYKKQLKLIDVLKRKQMHIEAARMLSFTEEEFIKAMDWGND